MKLRHFFIFILLFFTTIFIFGCNRQEAANQMRVGTISGPETELMEVAKQVALKKYGLNIHIVTFNDYSLPNKALADGDIDANMFQTIAYLQEDAKAHNYHFTIVSKTFIYPMAIYSKKIKRIADVPVRATVTIPNDPSNEARALQLLQNAGLIKLNSKASSLATIADIVKNPKALQIKALNAAQLPRSLDEVSLAVINTNYATPAGLNPRRNGLFVENKSSPYANVLVVNSKDKDNPKVKQLVEALQSQAVIDASETLFDHQAIPAWDVKKKIISSSKN